MQLVLNQLKQNGVFSLTTKSTVIMKNIAFRGHSDSVSNKHMYVCMSLSKGNFNWTMSFQNVWNMRIK